MTKDIPEDDQLFTGLKDITYSNYEENANFSTTKSEVEAALATAPNGAIFGSSYHRLPFSMGVSRCRGSIPNCAPWWPSRCCATTDTSVAR